MAFKFGQYARALQDEASRDKSLAPLSYTTALRLVTQYYPTARSKVPEGLDGAERKARIIVALFDLAKPELWRVAQ